MPQRYILVILSFFCASLAPAQNREKPADNIFTKKLSNGLDVLVVEDHSVPLATIVVTFKAGAFTETKENNGLTGLYQQMMVKGNKDFADQTARNYHAGQLGIKLSNTATAEDYSRCYFTLPVLNLEAGLKFMNTSIRFAAINSDELEKEKSIINYQLKLKQARPGFLLGIAMEHHLWGDLYSRKSPMGDSTVINAATPELLRVIKDRYFYPNNAQLIIAGDVDHSLVFKQVEQIYGDWAPSTFDPFKKWPIPEFKRLEKTDYFIVESKLSQTPIISICWQGPDTRNDINSTYAADVFSNILNQNSSRLTKALVETGLATSININYITLKYVGPVILSIIPDPTKVKECIQEVKRQIALMDGDNYITNEQLETAKRTLAIDGIRKEDITTDYVHTLSFWWACASINYYTGYYNNLDKISKADIKKYVQKYIKNQPYCAGLFISPDLRASIQADDFFKAGN